MLRTKGNSDVSNQRGGNSFSSAENVINLTTENPDFFFGVEPKDPKVNLSPPDLTEIHRECFTEKRHFKKSRSYASYIS